MLAVRSWGPASVDKVENSSVVLRVGEALELGGKAPVRIKMPQWLI